MQLEQCMGIQRRAHSRAISIPAVATQPTGTAHHRAMKFGGKDTPAGARELKHAVGVGRQYDRPTRREAEARDRRCMRLEPGNLQRGAATGRCPSSQPHATLHADRFCLGTREALCACASARVRAGVRVSVGIRRLRVRM